MTVPARRPVPPADFKRWRFWRRWLGRRAERAAARFLRRLGYRILARNVADDRGELDLLALDRDVLVVVEVRSTSTADPLRAAESVDLAKQRRLTAAALRFLSRRRLVGANVRFDVIAIAWPPNRGDPIVTHFRDAFEPTDRFQMFS